ncbi:hypothetical protein [Paraburkholderia terricola]|uniref:hypothetical protein n=1 Tax=Paraburkholderia terricola TaxID=169427 RepID=UPI001FD1EDF8|nr:hypothetical protein [Paraburkholderia terricola]
MEAVVITQSEFIASANTTNIRNWSIEAIHIGAFNPERFASRHTPGQKNAAGS